MGREYPSEVVEMSAWSFPRVSFGRAESSKVRSSQSKWKMPLMLAAAVMVAFVATGCDDHVQITRDPDVRIRKGASWAWAPEPVVAALRVNRIVFSLDQAAVQRSQRREIVRGKSPKNHRREHK